MPKSLSKHVGQLQEYLFQGNERNEDIALSYFRNLYGETFKRQSDAANADGYVPGHFLLELKGNANDWYQGLFQGLAYLNKGLSYSLLVVVAKRFLAVWQVSAIPEEIRAEISEERIAPNAIGRKYARKYAAKKAQLLRKACWYRPEIFGDLFGRNTEHFQDAIKAFEKTLDEKKKVRQSVTLQNFVSVLDEMKQFFDQTQRIKTVRAFYSMIYGPWDESSVLVPSNRYDDRATLGGAEITDLIPQKRPLFKEFVENRRVALKADENIDDFFSRYDEALDRVDKNFRVRNGIFFTDLDLSKFVMWLVKQKIPNLGRNHLVIDPACGSGNLVTNWRSPLELRHKVVSEIEPELLYAVEQRMKGDQWHNGKFTVVPKVSENKGLNFLDKSAKEYIEILKKYLIEKGQKPNRPLAFLCNPPYRSDDDQSADTVPYKVNEAIAEIIGKDAVSERYCCFLAQMKLVCKEAPENGIPEDSVLLLFSKAAWLTRRPMFQQVRRAIVGSFEDLGGILVNGKEFFDIKGSFPIAFTMWRFRGDGVLDSERNVPLLDLTWMKKSSVSSIPWSNSDQVESSCVELTTDIRARKIFVDQERLWIKDWLNQTMTDFKRSRRREEIGDKSAGGLPRGDHRRDNTKAYGETGGAIVGFMDDLTPCRVKKGRPGIPWFRLNSQFMDCRKTRCYSGPPTHFGYSAFDFESARKVFLWYSLARTFEQEGYPMWVDAMEMWVPTVGKKFSQLLLEYSFAIGYAENECAEAVFPANNPASGAIEVYCDNPMTPHNPNSFWLKTMKPAISGAQSKTVCELIEAVDVLFAQWKKLFKSKKELIATYNRQYFVEQGRLRVGAGIVQIKDYAVENDERQLLDAYQVVQKSLRSAKSEFNQLLTSEAGINYFGDTKPAHKAASSRFVPKTKFDKVIERRLMLSAILIEQSKGDPNFGLTKFVKLFYLSDVTNHMQLETSYYRQAAGPLDPRALYNETIGLIPVAKRHACFETVKEGGLIRFVARNNHAELVKRARETLKKELPGIEKLVALLRPATTDQSEIIATLFACWNDLLLEEKKITDEMLVKEFLKNWHPNKKQYAKTRLLGAIKWMKEHRLVPAGASSHTITKWNEPDVLL